MLYVSFHGKYMSTAINSIGCFSSSNRTVAAERTEGASGCSPNAEPTKESACKSPFYTDCYEKNATTAEAFRPIENKTYQTRLESFRPDASADEAKKLWDNATMVIVSGDRGNNCGHALLRIGEPGDQQYFHTDSGYGQPFHMNEEGFQTYLQKQGKTQLHEEPISVRNPEATHKALNDSLSNKYLWTGLPTNCVTYIENIIRKGGEPGYDPYNCPKLNMPHPETPPLRDTHTIYGI